MIYRKKKNVKKKNSREGLSEEEFLHKGSVLQPIFFNYIKALYWAFENQSLESLNFKYTANGKRQIQVENLSIEKMSRQKQLQTILMDEKLRETTYLGVEIMNSKRQVKTKLGHVVKIRVCRLTWRNRDA